MTDSELELEEKRWQKEDRKRTINAYLSLATLIVVCINLGVQIYRMWAHI